MANIQGFIDKIRTAIYGKEVRGSLADGLDAVNKETEATSKKQGDLEATFDQLIINAGDSNAEIVASRHDSVSGETYDTLPKRLDANSEQSAYNADKIKGVTAPINLDGAILVIVDDDGGIGFIEKLKPVLDSKGVKCDIAVITDRVGNIVGNTQYMTLDQLKELKTQGYEITSHTKTHRQPNDLTKSELDDEFGGSLNYLIANGLILPNEDKILTYPYGQNMSLLVKEYAKKYYDYAIATDYINNKSVLDTYSIKRIQGDTTSLTDLKNTLDSNITNKTLMVILTHSYQDIHDPVKIGDLIDYAKSLNVPILTMSEAWKLKGNSLSIGEYENDKSLYVSRSGEAKALGIDPLKIYDTQQDMMNAPITSFKVGKITIVPIHATYDYLLKTGGTLQVYRFNPNDDYSFATYTPYNSNKLYMRKWNRRLDIPAWGEWELINRSQKYIDSSTTIDMNQDITAYETNTETIIELSVANDTLLKNGGVMKVTRISNDDYSFAVFTPFNLNEIYMRKWNKRVSPQTWGDWEKIAGNIKFISDSNFQGMDAPITAYSNNTETTMEVSMANDTLLNTGGL
ncbi:hypothetical protein C2H98_23745 [Niallia circulans]|uniref:polysaccharide deacetylase family protein n=1 Tax=Niallia circulans TaxID=1397 RepID=UPI000F454F81|nr:polysaccharide deacetylase family protein [Niallia circulans]AYV74332.1 hypothetical protein C2H98_23745 [Niallia circulans]